MKTNTITLMVIIIVLQLCAIAYVALVYKEKSNLILSLEWTIQSQAIDLEHQQLLLDEVSGKKRSLPTNGWCN